MGRGIFLGSPTQTHSKQARLLIDLNQRASPNLGYGEKGNDVETDNKLTALISNEQETAAEEEYRLMAKQQSGNLPKDMQGVSGASVERDLDLQRFREDYLPCVVSPETRGEDERDILEQLQTLHLMTSDGLPTSMAILVLGRDPDYWFPGAYVQFVRFDGNEITAPVLNQKKIRGTLPQQSRILDDILRVNIGDASDTSRETDGIIPDYPCEAMRELVRNAIIHRSYHSYTPVRVHWFSDSIEIISPGPVYGRVTPEQFGTPGATSYRNPAIAEAMKNMGFMERLGMGIAIASEALQKNGNPPLESDVEGNFIFVRIRRHT